jgi:centromere/kinetochore protein ZW10
MTLSDALVGLKSYKEVDERVEQLWHNLDASIVSPRMNFKAASLKSIASGPEELRLQGEADRSIDSLLQDLETVIIFVAGKLPADLLPPFSKLMMADMVPKLVNEWLDSGVPSSLQNMDKFQQVIQRAQQFCATLEKNGYTGFDEVKNWADKAPMIWLGKCRDTALDTVRSRLVNGIGDPKQVEKVERHMVTVSEGRELATTGAGAAADTNDWNEDWDNGWDDAENMAEQPAPIHETATNDEPADSWGGGDDEHAPVDPPNVQEATETDDFGDAWDWDADADNANEAGEQDAEDEGADAWGWRDEDTTEHPEPRSAKSTKPAKLATAAKPAKPTKPAQPSEQKTQRPQKEKTRELILKETYHISSMPERVLGLIFAVLEDGATLTQENGEFTLVAGTAAGLFSLPTFALALFRAISPHYYSLVNGGGM